MTNRGNSRSVETDDLVGGRSEPPSQLPALGSLLICLSPEEEERDLPSLPVLAFPGDAVPGLPGFPRLGLGGAAQPHRPTQRPAQLARVHVPYWHCPYPLTLTHWFAAGSG